MALALKGLHKRAYYWKAACLLRTKRKRGVRVGGWGDKQGSQAAPAKQKGMINTHCKPPSLLDATAAGLLQPGPRLALVPSFSRTVCGVGRITDPVVSVSRRAEVGRKKEKK